MKKQQVNGKRWKPEFKRRNEAIYLLAKSNHKQDKKRHQFL